MHALAPGRAYPHKSSQLDEAADTWPSPSTCVYPTPAQATALAAVLHERGMTTVVSIGCGEGAMEAQLEARGLTVHALDLDAFTDPARYLTYHCFCSSILRVRPDQLFDIPAPHETTALCFLWGRALPWRAYLEQYPLVPTVVIAGEPADAGADCATEPRGGALDDAAGWRRIMHTPIRAVHRGATLDVYAREAAAASAPADCREHDSR